MRLSYLQNHYNIEDVKDGYRFITDSGVEYFLTFIEYPVVEDYFATKIFMFNIERATPKVGQSDIKLMNTILFVLDGFFKNHDDALIAVSDIYDNRQAARKRLFDFCFLKIISTIGI